MSIDRITYLDRHGKTWFVPDHIFNPNLKLDIDVTDSRTGEIVTSSHNMSTTAINEILRTGIGTFSSYNVMLQEHRKAKG